MDKIKFHKPEIILARRTIQLISPHLEIFRKENIGADFAIVGSYANQVIYGRGDFGSGSDIDLATQEEFTEALSQFIYESLEREFLRPINVHNYDRDPGFSTNKEFLLPSQGRGITLDIIGSLDPYHLRLPIKFDKGIRYVGNVSQ